MARGDNRKTTKMRKKVAQKKKKARIKRRVATGKADAAKKTKPKK